MIKSTCNKVLFSIIHGRKNKDTKIMLRSNHYVGKKTIALYGWIIICNVWQGRAHEHKK